MRVCAFAVVLVGLLACTDEPSTAEEGDDDDTSAGDADADGDTDTDADGDADTDADADADAVPSCDGEQEWFTAWARPGRADDLSEGRSMVVTRQHDYLLQLQDDLSCNPRGEEQVLLDGSPVPDEVWLPPHRASVIVQLVLGGDLESSAWSYVTLRSPDAMLLWEGGTAFVEPVDGNRFRLVDDPDAPFCFREIECILRARIGIAVQTDDGEVQIRQGEHAFVTIEGEPFIAVAAGAEHTVVTEDGCVEGGGGDWLHGSAYVARTTELDLPLVDRLPAPSDPCPESMPIDRDPCTTIAGERCEYDRGNGCLDTFECMDCYWRITLQSFPDGVDCGFDPEDCMTNGNDGACSEEAVCTDCSCPDDERWRCLQPGTDCPPCG